MGKICNNCIHFELVEDGVDVSDNIYGLCRCTVPICVEYQVSFNKFTVADECHFYEEKTNE